MTVLQAIEDIMSGKAGSNSSPSFALSIEVARLTGMTLLEVARQAETLKSAGLIRIGKALNYSYYELRNETH